MLVVEVDCRVFFTRFTSSSLDMLSWMALWKVSASICRASSIWLPSAAMFVWMAVWICWLNWPASWLISCCITVLIWVWMAAVSFACSASPSFWPSCSE